MSVVSVIIPAYNSELLISRCIESVLCQHHLREVIIVDDCSGDSTLRLARSYAERDSRVEVIALPKNCGVAAARNTGVRASSGNIVAFLDSDDFWLPSHLAIAVHKLQTSEFSLISTSCLVSDGEKCYPRARKKAYFSKNSVLRGNDVITSSVVMTGEAARKYPFQPLPHEDMRLWYSLLSSGYSLVCDPEVTIVRDVSTDGLSRRASRSIKWHFQFVRELLGYNPIVIWIMANYFINATLKRIPWYQRLRFSLCNWKNL